MRDQDLDPVKPAPAADDPMARALADARPGDDPGLARDVRMNALIGAVVGAAPAPVTIGRWTLERQVGAGGMGVVYRARDPEGAPVALKLLNRDLQHARARFEREAALLRRIEHPRVVRYIDHGTTPEGQDYLVMEWLEGEDLQTRLRRGPLEVEEALTLAMEVAVGLGATHAAGVIHRDVKPANLFLVGRVLADVRVVDFGVARVEEDSGTRLTSTGSVLGTTQYMAPEQIQGHPELRTDVYGLGACLYECLVGAPPFRGDTAGDVILQVLSSPAPSVTGARPEVPPALDALVGRMLEKDPARRPQDMDAVILALADLLAGSGPAIAVSRAERRSIRSTGEHATQGEIIGRARELGQLRGLLAHAADEERSVIVACVGPTGIGRSALLRAASEEPREGRTLVARCAPDDAGVPFLLLRRLLGGQEDTGWLDTRSGEPLVVADRLRLAWLDVLDGWRAQPTTVFVDDLHSADVSSLRFLALACAHLRDAPFALVFTALHGALPTFAEADPALVRIPLEPLGKRSFRQLAERWFTGGAVPLDGAGADRLALCGGNPGELHRLRGLGHAEAAPAWARLDSLPPDLRRVARACALGGCRFHADAVAALLGLDPADEGLRADLDTLVREGLLQHEGGARDAERRFPSEAAWEAVLATCTDADRRRGAATIARWLVGRRRPGERGRNLLFLGERTEATTCFLDAVREAIAGDDDVLAERWLAAAEQSATPEQRGQVALLRAQVAFWRGRVDEAAGAATTSLADLPRGSRPWFEAASLGITTLGQRGDHDGLLRVVDAVLATPTAGAPDARTIALCRAISQLAALEGADTARLAAHALGDDAPARSAEARAWQARARAARASSQSFDESIAAQVEAHHAHVLAGDPRSAALIGLYLGSYYTWSGAWERAEAAIDDALRTARRLGVAYLDLWGRYVRGKLRVEIGDPLEAAALLEQIAAEAGGSPRIRAGAQIYASIAALRAGDPARAAVLAEAAQAHGGVARAALAARCRALVAMGDHAALVAAAPALVLGEGVVRVVEWDELVHLALAEAAGALGGDVREAARAATARIRARAETLADPLRRNDYLARPYIVGLTFALNQDLSEESPAR